MSDTYEMTQDLDRRERAWAQFAAAALQGLIVSNGIRGNAFLNVARRQRMEVLAANAAEMANLMLHEWAESGPAPTLQEP